MNELINKQRDQIAQLTAERDALAAQNAAWNAAFEHLFAHCLSNGMFNAWGQQLDCTLLNDARSAIPQHHLRQALADAVTQCVSIIDQTKTTFQTSSRYWKAEDITPDKFKENAISSLKRHRASILAGKE